MPKPKSHSDLDDDTFLQLFAGQSLAPELFTHEAHLRLAYLHIKRYGLEEAQLKVNHQIFQFVEALGAGDKFHKTLTIAAVKVMHHFMERAPEATFEALLLRFPRLKNNFKELITSHYSATIFQNPEAREKYLEPDLLPF